MKALSLAAVVLLSAPLAAQQTGVSHPSDAVIEDTATVSTGDIVDTKVPVVSAPVVVIPAGQGPVSDISTPAASSGAPNVSLKRHDEIPSAFDPDGAVVGDLPQMADALSTGTMLRMRLKKTIETASTQENTPFTAEITESVTHLGRVVIPAGSVVEGRVTEVRGGRRFHGAALIHLQPQDVVLPDGTRMPISASVIDTDQYANTRIDNEGNVVRKDHAKEMLTAMSLATGGAAAAGGVIAGVPGALVGAGIGAGVSTIWWLKQDRQTQLPAETLLVMALNSPAPIRSLVREPDYSSVSPTVQPRRQVVVESQPAPAEAPVATQSFVPTN